MRTSRVVTVLVLLVLALPVSATIATATTRGGAPAAGGVVVVLGNSSDGTKLALARGLASKDRVLLIARSTPCPGGLPPWYSGYREVICFLPVPLTTRGEARYASTYARAHGQRTMTVITGQDQLRRAELRFERCWSGPLSMVEAPQPLTRVLSRYPYQVAALLRAWFTQKSC